MVGQGIGVGARAVNVGGGAGAEHREAEHVESGGAGGHLAGLGPLIGEVAGVEPAAITFKKADIFKLDLSEATVLMLYLRPELNVKLIPQLKKLKPGSRIV